ncbi:hypothetical protein RJ639_047122 [Escallonia herrerae]|uniref:Reverse transcriptase Ty1/copia-type domain-containing protein n=1 Tax=Escallonia herrerae TaxID=1293975 RepID=A0AA88W6M7_9ASTE|nr:hypothetical protein RJ639_047122 [Escallonia herrerae]
MALVFSRRPAVVLDGELAIVDGAASSEAAVAKPEGCYPNKPVGGKKREPDVGSGVVICIYVDDMLIFCNDIDRINEAKNFLAANFSIKDLGKADMILGIKVIRSQYGIVLTPSSYIEEDP